jgi:hypothetical protein
MPSIVAPKSKHSLTKYTINYLGTQIQKANQFKKKKLPARNVGINQMKKTVLVKILLFYLLPSRIYTGSLYKEIFNEIPDKSNR